MEDVGDGMESFPPFLSQDRTWMLAKYTSLSGSPKIVVDHKICAAFSTHRRQLVVWNGNRMLICIDLHPVKILIPTKECYAIVKENNVNLCRLKFRSVMERASFGLALDDLVCVANDRAINTVLQRTLQLKASGSQAEEVNVVKKSPQRAPAPEVCIATSGVGGSQWLSNSPGNELALDNFLIDHTEEVKEVQEKSSETISADEETITMDNVLLNKRSMEQKGVYAELNYNHSNNQSLIPDSGNHSSTTHARTRVSRIYNRDVMGQPMGRNNEMRNRFDSKIDDHLRSLYSLMANPLGILASGISISTNNRLKYEHTWSVIKYATLEVGKAKFRVEGAIKVVIRILDRSLTVYTDTNKLTSIYLQSETMAVSNDFCVIFKKNGVRIFRIEFNTRTECTGFTAALDDFIHVNKVSQPYVSQQNSLYTEPADQIITRSLPRAPAPEACIATSGVGDSQLIDSPVMEFAMGTFGNDRNEKKETVRVQVHKKMKFVDEGKSKRDDVTVMRSVGTEELDRNVRVLRRDEICPTVLQAIAKAERKKFDQEPLTNRTKAHLQSSLDRCSICEREGDIGFRMGAVSCGGCAEFFRMSIQKMRRYQCSCPYDRGTVTTMGTIGNLCPCCRYCRCLKEGMKAKFVPGGIFAPFENSLDTSQLVIHGYHKINYSPKLADEIPNDFVLHSETSNRVLTKMKMDIIDAIIRNEPLRSEMFAMNRWPQNEEVIPMNSGMQNEAYAPFFYYTSSGIESTKHLHDSTRIPSCYNRGQVSHRGLPYQRNSVGSPRYNIRSPNPTHSSNVRRQDYC